MSPKKVLAKAMDGERERAKGERENKEGRTRIPAEGAIFDGGKSFSYMLTFSTHPFRARSFCVLGKPL